MNKRDQSAFTSSRLIETKFRIGVTMKFSTAAMIGVIMITLMPLGEDCFGQNRDRRQEKTKDYHGAKNEFHPPRRRGLENRIPIVIQRFRTINGSFNNLKNATWGMAGGNLRRRVPSDYADGISEPSGDNRPSARLISNLVCDQSEDIFNDRGLTSMVWQWGQFLDHDLSLTESHEPPEFFPIEVPAGDIFFDPFSTGTEMIFLFRAEYRESGANTKREHINALTSWIDGSNVYGSDAVTSRSLRTLSGGLMKTSDGNMLPVDDEGFFLAGDIRVNEQSGLICMHTIFMREHNRIAKRYAQLYPHLSDEQIFVRARKRVIGIMQAITYNEFLPALLGKNALRTYKGYKPNVFPNVTNVFATAAYRFGHTMLPPELLRLDENYSEVSEGNIALRDAFFNPEEVRTLGVDPYIRGLITQQAQEIDPHIQDEIRNFLFGVPGAGGFDLASLNIQRGRDHGLPDYNAVRMRFGLPPVSTFADITSDSQRQLALEEAYGDVDDIDPWIGMLSEDHYPGASVGVTLRTIMSHQFSDLRDADRFWYQHEMHPGAVPVIDATRLSNVINRNTGIRLSSVNVFQIEN
jgi:hypothetical protein